MCEPLCCNSEMEPTNADHTAMVYYDTSFVVHRPDRFEEEASIRYRRSAQFGTRGRSAIDTLSH